MVEHACLVLRKDDDAAGSVGESLEHGAPSFRLRRSRSTTVGRRSLNLTGTPDKTCRCSPQA
ncbi:hypothetical protein SERN_1691 [Serinibacter arcticus]|uniref:Uncharacterized protein n=1 Tax=Serinibacter arcticus TaxID=1655435 RepID=A0A4Z1E7W8_9MICO|nr:hypothetical protein SERN_1691 [Serinibacter arcticus]